MRRVPDGVFKPTRSRTEAKSDVTTNTSRKIVESEAAARVAKTERLRAARFARDATENVVPLAKKKRKQTGHLGSSRPDTTS
jgi:hypothetical protein